MRNKILLGLITAVLALSVMVSCGESGEPRDDGFLNGTWEDVSYGWGNQLIMNNGSYEYSSVYSDVITPDKKGSYSISGNTLKFTPGSTYDEDDKKWYTKSQIISELNAVGISGEAEKMYIEMIFPTTIVEYSLSDNNNTLTLQNDEDSIFGISTGEYTRK